MDEQFHTVPHVPDKIGSLDIAYVNKEFFSSFLCEPKELVPFKTAWGWQQKKRNLLFQKGLAPHSVWLLQHQPCYTIGRGGDKNNVLFDISNSDLEFYRIDRGGEVTHHLPGQLVVYLVIDLRRYKTDLHWYLRQLEGVIIDVLNELGLKGERKNGLTGIWCNEFKIGSIGVGCSKWITQHGLSLNIDCDMKGFESIVPCGLYGEKIGRLNYWYPGISVSQVQPVMKKALEKRFGFIWKNH